MFFFLPTMSVLLYCDSIQDNQGLLISDVQAVQAFKHTYGEQSGLTF